MAGLSDYDRENIAWIMSGGGDWFSAQLLRLIAKADPINRELLRAVFPQHVQAYEEYLNS